MSRTDTPGPFAQLLHQNRVAKALTQEELAERAGLSRRGVADLERGRRRAPHPASLRRLADALKLEEHEREALFTSARMNRNVRHNLPLQLTSFVGGTGNWPT